MQFSPFYFRNAILFLLAIALLPSTLTANDNQQKLDSLFILLNKQQKEKKALASTYLEIGMAHENWDSIIYWGLKARNSAQIEGNPLIEGKAAAHTINAYSYIGDIDKLLELGQASIDLIKATNDTTLVINALNNMASFGYQSKGEYAKAIDVFSQGLEWTAKRAKFITHYTIIACNMADSYARIGDEKMAMKVRQNVLELGEKYNSSIALGYSQLDLAINYRKNEDFKKARYFLNRVEQLLPQAEWPLKHSFLLQKTDFYHVQEQYDSALIVANQLLQTYEKRGMDYDIFIQKDRIGRIYVGAGQYEKALSYFAPTNQYYEKEGQFLRFIEQAPYRIEIYSHLGNFEKTNSIIKKSIEIGQRLNDQEGLVEIHRQSALFFEKYNFKEEALYHLKEYQKLKDKIFKLESQKMAEQMAIRFELKEKQFENQRLQAVQEKNEAQIRFDRTLIIAISTFLFLSIALGIQLYRNNQQKKRHNEELEAKVKERTMELEASNNALKEANEELEQSSEEIEQFAYITSHNMKEPMRNIMSFSQLLTRKKEQLDADGRDYIEFIQAGTVQMYNLIEGILAFISIRQMKVPIEEINVIELLEEIKKQFSVIRKEGKGEIVWEPIPNIVGNLTQLRVLFQGLIENGLKYNENPTPLVSVKHSIQDQYHLFEITDNGMGIHPDFQDQIFKLFKRLHSNRRKYPGSGVGLAICKRIVLRHNGKIWVESEEGQGASFKFTLPIGRT